MKRYDDAQKTVTAIRLKECRRGKGLSHERLAERLREEYDLKISVAVLKNYEVSEVQHSKFKTGFGMNIQYLYTLADFYDVSTDYLLGLTDVGKPEKAIEINARNAALIESIKRLIEQRESEGTE